MSLVLRIGQHTFYNLNLRFIDSLYYLLRFSGQAAIAIKFTKFTLIIFTLYYKEKRKIKICHLHRPEPCHQNFVNMSPNQFNQFNEYRICQTDNLVFTFHTYLIDSILDKKPSRAEQLTTITLVIIVKLLIYQINFQVK